jgi:hypothetical protein
VIRILGLHQGEVAWELTTVLAPPSEQRSGTGDAFENKPDAVPGGCAHTLATRHNDLVHACCLLDGHGGRHRSSSGYRWPT